MTAANCNLREALPDVERSAIGDNFAWHIEQTCRRVINGRHAARAISRWVHPFELSEVEFQLLWFLRSSVDHGFDQKTLAEALAISAAQVSATVERARSKGWIHQQAAQGDRRRHLWRLTGSGQDLIERMVRAATLLRADQQADGPGNLAEVAA